ncbi:hypothetical protein GC173_18585 [bacterium]|nr:hypothetical protein [bacterium]
MKLASALVLSALIALTAFASVSAQDGGERSSESEPQAVPTKENPVVRVGGDLTAEAVWDESKQLWKAGTSKIDTPLPVGYPPPTPPGAIDLKLYPTVRRAEYGKSRNGDGFFPLFNHIKRRDIAMTSPVEMDYPSEGPAVMSFLYRKAEQGPTGSDPEDARIRIRDTEQVMVISLGGRGSYDESRIQKDAETLRQWLEEHPQWEATGETRALLYNGPSILWGRKWLEVQIPVRERQSEVQEQSS